jgi:hypothetical protein
MDMIYGRSFPVKKADIDKLSQDLGKSKFMGKKKDLKRGDRDHDDERKHLMPNGPGGGKMTLNQSKDHHMVSRSRMDIGGPGAQSMANINRIGMNEVYAIDPEGEDYDYFYGDDNQQMEIMDD